MATPRVTIRDYRYEPDKAFAHRKAVIAAERLRLGTDLHNACIVNSKQVIPPYFPREPIPAGDPMSPSGTKVELSELADDVLAALAALSVSNRIYHEAPTGAVDGVNTVFVVAGNYVLNTEAVFFNGQRLDPGIGNDYVRVESGGAGTGFDSIILAIPPRSRPGARPDDILRIDYNPA